MPHLFEAHKVAILTTGGTIEKTYDERDGSLRNVRSVLNELLAALRLPGLEVVHVPVMAKDSLEMTPDDRAVIAEAVGLMLKDCDAALVVHGTDTLAETGEVLHRSLAPHTKPVVLTGAFRPHEFRDSDALQNITESLFALRVLPAGVYAVFHGRALAFPGVAKDREERTFKKTS